MDILSIGFVIPYAEMVALAQLDRYPGIQTYRHNKAIVAALEGDGETICTLRSFAAVSDFPRHPRRVIQGRAFSHTPSARDHWHSSLNVFPIKQGQRSIQIARDVSVWARGRRQGYVLVYGTQAASLLGIILGCAWHPVVKVAIMTDPPSVDLPDEGITRRCLRRIDRSIQKWCMSKLDGVVTLAASLSDRWAPTIPTLLCEGVLDPDIEQRVYTPYGVGNDGGAFRAVYAGALRAEYGVDLLLGAARLLPPGCIVDVFGSGPAAPMVAAAATEGRALRYHGFVAPTQVWEKLTGGDVLLNVRPAKRPSQVEGFPSKLLEYLCTGRAIISTKLPAIPDDVGRYVDWLEIETPEELAKLIVKVRARRQSEIRQRGEEARKFVLDRYATQAVGKRLRAFLRTL